MADGPVINESSPLKRKRAEFQEQAKDPRIGSQLREAVETGVMKPTTEKPVAPLVSSSTPEIPVNKSLTPEEQIRMARLGTTNPPPTPEQLKTDIDRIATARANQIPKSRV